MNPPTLVDADTLATLCANSKYDLPFDLDHDAEPGHWVGPYGVLVPNEVTVVVASDGVNLCGKEGGELETEMASPYPLDESTYKAKYATLDADGMYYYKRRN